MHGHPPHTTFRRHRPQRGRHIVDERGANPHRSGSHCFRPGVNGDANRATECVSESFDHRDHPAEFLVGADGVGARPGRLAADVDHLRLETAKRDRITLADGAVAPWAMGHTADYFTRMMAALGEAMGFDVDTPWRKLPARAPHAAPGDGAFPWVCQSPNPLCWPRPQEEMMRRLAAGANSGRASTAEKALERLKAEGTYVEKPFVPKKR